MRLITKTPSMVMETIEEASELGQALEMLFYLHSLRWRKRGLPGSFAIKKIRCFHEEYAHLALLKGRLRLSTLTSDEEPVGAIYAMCVGGIYYFYQSGFDPVQKSISPGTTLVGHTIRSAIEEGAKQFDFMRGEEPYKARWKPQNLLKNMRMLKASASFRGMVGEVLSASASKAKNAIENHLVKRQAVLSR
jgi:CelD/BcsL family acetyltransferase involved in cellulose biosynthesis